MFEINGPLQKLIETKLLTSAKAVWRTINNTIAVQLRNTSDVNTVRYLKYNFKLIL